MKPTAKLPGIALIAAMGLASCSSDELQEVYEGEGISFNTQVSRAVTTTINNLDGFYVYADGAGYKHMFLTGMKAEKDGSTNNYLLEQKVTWPADLDEISFWCYGPLAAKNYLTPDINATSQHIHNYRVDQSLEDGGLNQHDFVLTYAKANKTPGNQVSLQFHHALSQVEIHARLGENHEQGRRVKIKGAWLVNVNSIGDVEFTEGLADEYHHMRWANLEQPVSYGCMLSNGAALSTNPAPIVANEGDKKERSLMLIPQTINAYAFPKTAEATPSAHEGDIAPIAETGTAGAYILVLCRVETHHNTPVTPEGMAENPAIKADDNNQGHTHQLFPITKDAEGKFIYTEEAYGYTCVPVDINWLPGKKYKYTLQFCGRGSGAGQYPPAILPDGIPVDDTHINTPEDGKKPGDNVLDNEITFKVEVLDWVESTEDIKSK